MTTSEPYTGECKDCYQHVLSPECDGHGIRVGEPCPYGKPMERQTTSEPTTNETTEQNQVHIPTIEELESCECCFTCAEFEESFRTEKGTVAGVCKTDDSDITPSYRELRTVTGGYRYRRYAQKDDAKTLLVNLFGNDEVSARKNKRAKKRGDLS